MNKHGADCLSEQTVTAAQVTQTHVSLLLVALDAASTGMGWPAVAAPNNGQITTSHDSVTCCCQGRQAPSPCQ